MAEAFSSSDKLPSGSGKLLRAALQLDNQEDTELGLHLCRLLPSEGICGGQWAGVTQAGGRAVAPRSRNLPQPCSQPSISVPRLPPGASTACSYGRFSPTSGSSLMGRGPRGPRMDGYRQERLSVQHRGLPWRCMSPGSALLLPSVPLPLAFSGDQLPAFLSHETPVLPEASPVSVPQPPDLSTGFCKEAHSTG